MLTEEIYGTKPKNPERNDILLYKKFVLINKNAKQNKKPDISSRMSSPIISNKYKKFNYSTIMREKAPVYEEHLLKTKLGELMISPVNLNVYENYMHKII